MKNRRSLFVNWTRPRTLRCSTISCCLSAAFSASSRPLDLKSEAARFKRRNISAPIAASVKRFCSHIKRTRFSAHTPRSRRIHQHRVRLRRRCGWSRTREIGHAVDLARHDEIVLVQSLDLLRAQRNGRVTPAEADVGVMAFALGKLADPLHEGERFPEIAKSKRALNAVGFIAQLPIRSLALEAQGFIARKRRHATATRRAGFLREGLRHVTVCHLSIKRHGGAATRRLPPHRYPEPDHHPHLPP